MSFAIDWIIDSATAGTLLSGAGLLVLAVLRRPGLKQRWGEAVMAACIVVCLIVLVPGRPKLSLSLIRIGGGSLATPGITGHRPHIGLLVSSAASSGTVAGPAAKRAATGRKAAAATSMGQRLGAYFWGAGLRWLEIIYLCGALFMLVRTAIGQWLLRRLHTAASPVPASVQQQWDRLLGDWRYSRWARPPRLLVAPNIGSPLTFGILRPVVLIPPGLCESRPALELQSVLLHELAHIRRRDGLTDAVGVTAEILFFYQPLLWWLRRKVRLYREYMADQQAAASMASPSQYAVCLLELARAGGGIFASSGPANRLLGSHSEFYQRMKQLLQSHPVATPESPIQTKWLLIGAAALVAATTSITLRAGAGLPLWQQPGTVPVVRPVTSAAGTANPHRSKAPNAAVAVNRGTAYLLRHQGSAGQWLGRYGPAVTALVVKALVANGHSLSERPVRNALAFIASCRQSDGGFYTNTEPIYNTAIVISTLSTLPTHRFNRQIQRGLQFLKITQSLAAGQDHQAEASWFYRRRIHSALDDELTMEALRAAGLPPSDSAVQHALAMLRQNSIGLDRTLDPQERSSGEILPNYGLLTYAQLKSMIYAGLSRHDPRVQRLVRWISNHYTLRVNPASNNGRGRYYYYLTFAKALRVYGQATITDEAGIRHNWRRELYRRLTHAQQANGSWVNHSSSEYLEGNPLMATTYAVLTLEQIDRPLQ